MIRKNNLGSFYKFVNSKLETNMTAMALKTSTGVVVTDPGEKAELFNNFFSDVFTSDNGICPSVAERIGDEGLSTVTFMPNIVRQVLKKLKPSMSTGWDGIPNRSVSYTHLTLPTIYSV